MNTDQKYVGRGSSATTSTESVQNQDQNQSNNSPEFKHSFGLSLSVGNSSHNISPAHLVYMALEDYVMNLLPYLTQHHHEALTDGSNDFTDALLMFQNIEDALYLQRQMFESVVAMAEHASWPDRQKVAQNQERNEAENLLRYQSHFKIAMPK